MTCMGWKVWDGCWRSTTACCYYCSPTFLLGFHLFLEFLFGTNWLMILPLAMVDNVTIAIAFRSLAMSLRILPIASIRSAIGPSKDPALLIGDVDR